MEKEQDKKEEPKKYNSFKLAKGSKFTFMDVITLTAIIALIVYIINMKINMNESRVSPTIVVSSRDFHHAFNTPWGKIVECNHNGTIKYVHMTDDEYFSVKQSRNPYGISLRKMLIETYKIEQ